MDPFPNIGYSAQQDALAWFRQEELIRVRLADEKRPEGFALTGRGEAFVKAICTTPLPVKQWVMPTERRNVGDINWLFDGVLGRPCGIE